LGGEPIEIGRISHRATPVRLAAMNSLCARTLADALACMPPWSVYPVPADGLFRYLTAAEPGAPRFALTLGDELAGVAGLRLNWLRGPYLQMLAVLPAHQGKGLGQLVLDWMERDAQVKGEHNLWVCASAFNANALRFYERAGFQRTATLDGLVSEEIAEILLRKRLLHKSG
jgi:ribosomal protein S18 acetylase RimI-like enzyme